MRRGSDDEGRSGWGSSQMPLTRCWVLWAATAIPALPHGCLAPSPAANPACFAPSSPHSPAALGGYPRPIPPWVLETSCGDPSRGVRAVGGTQPSGASSTVPDPCLRFEAPLEPHHLLHGILSPTVSPSAVQQGTSSAGSLLGLSGLVFVCRFPLQTEVSSSSSHSSGCFGGRCPGCCLAARGGRAAEEVTVIL